MVEHRTDFKYGAWRVLLITQPVCYIWGIYEYGGMIYHGRGIGHQRGGIEDYGGVLVSRFYTSVVLFLMS